MVFRLREWQIRKATERVEDAKHHLTFLHVPSQRARQERKILRLQRRLYNLKDEQ